MAKPRFRVIPAVHVFFIEDGRVLLLRRFNTGYEDGRFSVPAGHLDGDETVTAAAVREALEETGAVISPDDLEVVHVMHRRIAGEADERIDFFLRVHRWRGEPGIREPDKCDELSWHPLPELPGPVVPYVRSALRHHTEGVHYSEFGWSGPATAAGDVSGDR